MKSTALLAAFLAAALLSSVSVTRLVLCVDFI